MIARAFGDDELHVGRDAADVHVDQPAVIDPKLPWASPPGPAVK
ncbi:MAG: hypothetical protein QOD48_2250 [Gaiellaceae bacterium]|jgi:hypothetical protein|nr:hypothetical protein [Gaiellaceae bacterium]